MDSIKETIRAICDFITARDWWQFHNEPRDVAESLVLESAEVLELFQWGKNPDKKELELELADVAVYLFELAEMRGVDLLAAIRRKLEINERRYPVEKCRGKNTKYDKL